LFWPGFPPQRVVGFVTTCVWILTGSPWPNPTPLHQDLCEFSGGGTLRRQHDLSAERKCDVCHRIL